MVSEKMKTFMTGNSAIRAMFEEGKKMAKVYGSENVYDFSLGNPSVEPPKEVNEAAINILRTANPNSLHGYPNNSGYEDVRLHLALRSNSIHGTDYSEKNYVITTGAAAALNIILKVILDPGDEVIVFAPYFGEYNNYVKNYDGIVVPVMADLSTFQPDLSSFEQKLSDKTRAVIINTPNNPTGVVYSEETIKAISLILDNKSRQTGKPVYLISDEPYRELVYDNIKVPFVPDYYNNTFVAYSYSKSLSIPGERIGYVCVNSAADGFDEIVSCLNVANRILGFVNAPTIWQKVIPYCSDLSVDKSVYELNRKDLYSQLCGLGYECVKPQGAFYMFPKTLIPDDKEFCNAAKEFRLLIVPGSSFGCPGFCRISYCVSHDTVINSYESFKALKEKFSR
ncbi:pyridoxal phosphate-dependent aminotransferase [Lachnospiraceae bacterium NSJ-143]|nr:pyridoxal phosphate-dependent aminotransferase [Lachnospiraceae bacterium NSJ-143]